MGLRCGDAVRLTGGALGDIALADSDTVSRANNTGREPAVAICVTGQIRGLPYALHNWRRTVLPLLVDGLLSDSVDFFVFTSNTSSFTIWQQFLQSLSPVVLEVVQSWRFGRRIDDDEKCWSTARACDDVSFAVEKFPRLRYSLFGSLLVQHYQMERCRRTILQHEKQVGRRYARIARLRTDVVFSGLDAGFSSDQPKQHVKCLSRPGAGNWCFPALNTVRRDACRMCAAEAWAKSPSIGTGNGRVGRAWAAVHDWFMLGTREAVLAHLQGLRLLQHAGPRIRLSGLQDSWTRVILPAAREELSATVSQSITIYHPWLPGAQRGSADPSIAMAAGACTAAVGGLALLRAAGGQVRRFFLDWEDNASRATDVACLVHGGTWQSCVTFVQQWWAVPPPPEARCLGLLYDEPATRDRTIRLCDLKHRRRTGRDGSGWHECMHNGLLMGHVQSFGAKRFIGDVGSRVNKAGLAVLGPWPTKRILDHLQLVGAWVNSRQRPRDGFD